jgi:hypothetical protein
MRLLHLGLWMKNHNFLKIVSKVLPLIGPENP